MPDPADSTFHLFPSLSTKLWLGVREAAIRSATPSIYMNWFYGPQALYGDHDPPLPTRLVQHTRGRNADLEAVSATTHERRAVALRAVPALSEFTIADGPIKRGHSVTPAYLHGGVRFNEAKDLVFLQLEDLMGPLDLYGVADSIHFAGMTRGPGAWTIRRFLTRKCRGVSHGKSAAMWKSGYFSLYDKNMDHQGSGSVV